MLALLKDQQTATQVFMEDCRWIDLSPSKGSDKYAAKKECFQVLARVLLDEDELPLSELSVRASRIADLVQQHPRRLLPYVCQFNPGLSFASDTQPLVAERICLLSPALTQGKPAIDPRDVGAQKAYRVRVVLDTLNLIRRTCQEAVREAQDGCMLFPSAGQEGARLGNCARGTELSVQSKDCLVVAEELVRRGYQTAVLNMASLGHFGGGYRNGARAQEEDLCRRTTLAAVLEPRQEHFYPLDSVSPSAVLYTPSIRVLKAGYDHSYQQLPEPFSVNMLTVAACHNPPLEEDPETKKPRLTGGALQVTRERIRTLYEAAFRTGQQALVLSAFGCGAFKNPPGHIAEIFMDVLSKEYSGCFQAIVFAVLDDHNTGGFHNPDGNFRPFAEEIRNRGGFAINARGERLEPVLPVAAPLPVEEAVSAEEAEGRGWGCAIM